MQKAIDNINFDEAFIHCEKITKNHYENFPVASVLIPKEKRKYVYAVYSFARYADDIADSAILNSEEKLTRLNFLEDELDRVINNLLDNLHEETKYIFIALYKTLQDLNIPSIE